MECRAERTQKKSLVSRLIQKCKQRSKRTISYRLSSIFHRIRPPVRHVAGLNAINWVNQNRDLYLLANLDARPLPLSTLPIGVLLSFEMEIASRVLSLTGKGKELKPDLKWRKCWHKTEVQSKENFIENLGEEKTRGHSSHRLTSRDE